MKLNSQKIYSIYLYLSLLCSGAIMIFVPLDILTPKVLTTYFYWFLTGAMIVFYFVDHLHHIRKTGLYVMALVGFCGISEFLMGSGKWSVTQPLSFIAMPLLCLSVMELRDRRAIKKSVCFFALIMSLFFIYLSCTPVKYVTSRPNVFYYLNSGKKTATMGYYNPNETALFLMFCVMVLTYIQIVYKNKLVNLLIWADILYLIGLILETGSRTVFLILVVIALLYGIYSFRKMRKMDFALVLCAPVLYVILALSASAIKNLIIEGQDIFTGREIIYLDVFQSLDPLTFFVGNFGKYPFLNMHNGYISLFAAIGAIGLGLYLLFLLCLCRHAQMSYSKLQSKEDVHSRGRRWMIGCLMGLILTTSTEAAIFIYGSIIATGVMSVYVLLLPDQEESPENHIHIIPGAQRYQNRKERYQE